MEDTVDLGVEGLSPAVYVGAGGSANVFAARVVGSGQEVAVKLLRASADSAKERERFQRERETLNLLSTHDGIVHVVDAGVTDRNEPYFLMPLMEGSLQDRIDSEGALHWETATQLIAEVADTIEFAHSQKILHRDLKPGNILLDTAGVPRVADFGIAKLLDSNVSKSSKALGTPSFMPPERFKAVEATEASDVYGLGATLAALLTGNAPFLTGENDTDAAVMMRVMSEEPAPLSDAGIPGPIAAVVTRSMAKEPSERPESAAEFANLLRTATIDAGGAAAAGPVTVAIPRRDLTIPEFTPLAPSEDDEKKKPVLLLAAAAFVLLIGLGGAAFALTQTGGDDPVEVEVAGVDEVAGTDDDNDAEAGAASSGGDEESANTAGSGDSGGLDGESDATGAAIDGQDENDEDGDTAETAGQDGATGATDGNDGGDGGEDTGSTTGGNETGDPVGGETNEEENEGKTPDTVAPPVTKAPDPKPTACSSVSQSSVEVGDKVTFSNCSRDATGYSWNFGDGTTSSSKSPSKSWTTAGSKTVRLTATGPGGTHTYSITVTVTSTPPPPVEPSACFTAGSYSLETGDTVSFSNCSKDATSYKWSFGDGSSSSLANPTKSWITAGSKTVTLTATGAGGTDTETRTFTVTAPAVKPTACFTVNNSNPVVNNDSVTFSNCSKDATSYSWKFGDGTTSSQTSPSHTYNQVNTYTATLTATGPGGTHSTTKTITVKNQDRLVNDPPQAENISCQNISATQERWSWDVYGRVDDYVMVLTNGSTQSMGRSSGFTTANGTLKAIRSDRDGLETTRTIGSASTYGCTGWVEPTVPSPTGVSCYFSNFQANDDNTNWKSWTSHWSWSVHPDVDSYIVVFDTTGARVNVGKSGSFTATDVKGFRDGSQIQQIIAVAGGTESQARILTSCGSEGGGPTWKDFPG